MCVILKLWEGNFDKRIRDYRQSLGKALERERERKKERDREKSARSFFISNNK
jgi:hypothetical protein